MAKGQIFEFGIVLSLVLVVAIILVTMHTISGELIIGLNASGTNTTAIQQSQGAILNMDSVMAFVFIGFCIAVIISSFVMDTHPIFFIFSYLMLTIMVIISVIYSNFYNTFASNPAFSNSANQFTMTALVMNNLPYLIVLMGGAFCIAVYSRFGRGSSEQL